MSFIFAKTLYMNKIKFIAIILTSMILISSCTTYRGSAGGGCSMNRNMVGYK
ncbi:MAG: hypothetical protein RL131_1444 [Bacteroidota bacterium]